MTAASPRVVAAGRERLRGDPLAVVHAALLVLGWLFLLGLATTQWFFGDDWELLVGARRALPWDDELLRPHNEHWSTAPIVLYRALEHVFGLGSHLPFMVPVVTAHVAVAHVLWRLLLRVGAAPPVALAGSTLFLFLPAAHENVFWAFQIGFVAALLLGLTAVLLVDHEGAWSGRDWTAAALLVVALPFTSLPVALAAVAAAVQAVRRGVRAAALLVLPAAAVFAAWWLAYHADSAYAARDAGEYRHVAPDYVVRGLAAAFEQTLVHEGRYVGGVGAVLTVALVALLAWRAREAGGRPLAAYVCAGGAVLVLALTAYGRAQLGPEQAATPRYVYVTAALLLPAVGLALTWLVARFRRGPWLAAAPLFLLALEGVVVLAVVALREADREREVRRVLAAASDLVASRPVVGGAQAEPRFTPDLIAADLARWRADGFLSDVEYGPRDRVTAETNLFVWLLPTPAEGTTVVEQPCTADGSPLRARAAAATSYRIEAEDAGTLRVRLRDDELAVDGAVREIPAPPGVWYLSVLVHGRTLEVWPGTGGSVSLCG